MISSQTPEGLDVYTRDIACGEPIEKLNYTVKYPPIRVYCAKDANGVQGILSPMY